MSRRAGGKQSERKLQRLFTPIRVGKLELKNRIISPMIDRLATHGEPTTK